MYKIKICSGLILHYYQIRDRGGYLLGATK